MKFLCLSLKPFLFRTKAIMGLVIFIIYESCLRPYHVETSIPVRSLKLGDVESGQEFDGWRFLNTRFSKLECVGEWMQWEATPLSFPRKHDNSQIIKKEICGELWAPMFLGYMAFKKKNYRSCKSILPDEYLNIV